MKTFSQRKGLSYKIPLTNTWFVCTNCIVHVDSHYDNEDWPVKYFLKELNRTKARPLKNKQSLTNNIKLMKLFPILHKIIVFLKKYNWNFVDQLPLLLEFDGSGRQGIFFCNFATGQLLNDLFLYLYRQTCTHTRRASL